MTAPDPRPRDVDDSGATGPSSGPPSPGPSAGTEPSAEPGPSAGTGGSHSARAAATPAASAAPDDAFPVPHGPPTTGAGGHLLGVLIGLVLTGAALLLLLLGQSRIVADGVGARSVSPDPLGITLVTVGAVLAALVALLAVRSSAIPFTGGLLGLLVGAAYLFAPAASQRETVRLLATAQNNDAVLTIVGVATTGTPFVLGLVLLATGTAASLVRRRGIEVGSFRARTASQVPRARS